MFRQLQDPTESSDALKGLLRVVVTGFIGLAIKAGSEDDIEWEQTTCSVLADELHLRLQNVNECAHVCEDDQSCTHADRKRSCSPR
jgi:hypothetical protein